MPWYMRWTRAAGGFTIAERWTLTLADGRRVFAKMATYGVAVLVLLVAGTAAVAREVVLLVLRPEYLDAVPVVPLIGIAMGLQGLYQLTSIGLNLTSRTEFSSVSTMTAAVVGIVAAPLLIPRSGVVGAAETVLLAYAVQAVIAGSLAQRLYPIRYETGRLARVAIAGAVAGWVALQWPPMAPLAGFLVRGTTVVAQTKEEKIRQARQKGYEGDPCSACGQLTLVRSGACAKCDTCGETSGCS